MKRISLIILTLVFSSLSLLVAANGSLSCSTPWSMAVPVFLVERKVAVIAQNGLAFMEVEDIFLNPTNHQCEGVYKFKMPPGAFASGFWINTNEKEWVKGEIREITQARQIYQTITSRLIDPGILEQKDNEILIRVFPIESRKKVGIKFRCFFSAHGENERLVFNFPVGYSAALSAMDRDNDQPGPQPVKFSFSAGFVDNADIADVVTSNDKIKIKNLKKRCDLSLSADADMLEDLVISYRTPENENTTVVPYKIADGDKYSLIRLRNITQASSDKRCRLAIVVDASGSMGYRNKERAIKAVKAVAALSYVDYELFVVSAGAIRQVQLDELESMNFYGPTDWNALEQIPVEKIGAGIVLITDGDKLLSRHLSKLSARIARAPVQLVYVRSEFERNLAVMAENCGGSFWYDKAVNDTQLAEALKKSVEMLKNNPFLNLPDNTRVMPLFGSLAAAAYYVLPFKAGGYALKNADGTEVLSFSINDSAEPQTVKPWFTGIAARQQIKQLEALEQTPEVIKSITDLGLRYSQATDYTAFLAVPESIAKANADAFNPAYLAMFAGPNFRKARSQARIKACYANQRVLAGALEMYSMDNTDLSKLGHNLETGLFNIQELVDQKYLKSIPLPVEHDCDYRMIGDYSKEGFIACMRHGCTEEPEMSVEELVSRYCSAHGLKFEDFDLPYEVYSIDSSSYEELESKIRRYEMLTMFLSLMM